MSASTMKLLEDARHSIADLVVGLDDEARTGSTLCELWTPHQVLAHLVTFVDISFPKIMLKVVKHKGDFDAAANVMARDYAEKYSVEELAATLKAKSSKTPPLPGFPAELPLVDAVVHAQDIRRGLKLEGQPDPDAVIAVLNFLTGHKKGGAFSNRKPLEGAKLEATDSNWSFGSGNTVSGTGEALMMMLVGRDTHAELDGPS